MNNKINFASLLLIIIMSVTLFGFEYDFLPGHAWRIDLIDTEMSQFRRKPGQWKIVGDAFIDPNDKETLAWKSGEGILINRKDGKSHYLMTKQKFGDMRLHVEFMLPHHSNSGIYFMGRYEVQIFDSYGKKGAYPGMECGGIYQRWDKNREPKGYEGHSPKYNASFQPGKWQCFDIVFRAPGFDGDGNKTVNACFEKIVHNGYLVHENVEVTGPTGAAMTNSEKPTGPLRIQGDHGPIAYRNIRIYPANSSPFFAMDTGTGKSRLSAEKQVEMLKDLDYEGIGFDDSLEKLPEMIRQLDKHNLRLFNIFIKINIDKDPDYYISMLEDTFKMLKGRDAYIWISMTSKQIKPSDPVGDRRAIAVLNALADPAEENDLKIALYPHYLFWLETIEDAVRLAEKIDCPAVGVTFNLCHWLAVTPPEQEDILKETLIKAKPYLYLVTINGATNNKGWNNLIQTLDKGTFDNFKLLKILKENGYHGPIGLQGYGIKGNPRNNLRDSMAAWKKLQEKLQ